MCKQRQGVHRRYNNSCLLGAVLTTLTLGVLVHSVKHPFDVNY